MANTHVVILIIAIFLAALLIPLFEGENFTSLGVKLQDVFCRVQVPSQPLIVCHTSNDTIHLTPRNGIVITTNGTNNTAFIAFNGNLQNFTFSNVGAGSQVFKGLSGFNVQYRTLTQGTGIALTQTANEIQIASNFRANTQGCAGTDKFSSLTNTTGVFGCTPDQNTAQIGNSGNGVSIFGSRINATQNNLKTLRAGSGISLSSNASDITITNTSPSAFTAFQNIGHGGKGILTSSGLILQGKNITSANSGITISSNGTDVLLTNTIVDTNTAQGTNLFSTNGAGTGIFASRANATNLNFKSLTGTNGVTITTNATNINIAAGGGGGAAISGVKITPSQANPFVNKTGSVMYLKGVNGTGGITITNGTKSIVIGTSAIPWANINKAGSILNDIGSPTSAYSFNNQRITSLGIPTVATDAQISNHLGIIGNLTSGSKCPDQQILKYQSSNQTWICAVDQGGTTNGQKLGPSQANIFLSKSGSNLQFRGLNSTNGISLNNGSTNIITIGANSPTHPTDVSLANTIGNKAISYYSSPSDGQVLTFNGTNSTAIWKPLPVEVLSPSYIIYKSGSTYYAENGTTGVIVYSSGSATTTIQNTINALTKGGLIFIKAGNYTITASIDHNKNKVILQGEGDSTLLRESNGANLASIINLNADDIAVRNLKLDVNGGTQIVDSANGIIYVNGQRFLVDHITIVNANLYGFDGRVATEHIAYGIIQNSHIDSSGWDNMKFDNMTQIQVIHNTLTNPAAVKTLSGRDITVWHGKDSIFANNFIRHNGFNPSAGGAYGLVVSRNSTGIGILGNTFTNCNDDCISVAFGSHIITVSDNTMMDGHPCLTVVSGSYDVSVTNNVMNRCSHGMGIEGNDGGVFNPTNRTQAITVTGNAFVNSSASGIYMSNTISSPSYTRFITITNNIFKDNALYGLNLLTGNVRNVTLIGNVFINNTSGSYHTASALNTVTMFHNIGLADSAGAALPSDIAYTDVANIFTQRQIINSSTSPPMKIIRQTTQTSIATNTLFLTTQTNGTQADGLGGQIIFNNRNGTTLETQIGALQILRNSANNKGQFQFANGAGLIRFSISDNGETTIVSNRKLCFDGSNVGSLLTCGNDYIISPSNGNVTIFSAGFPIKFQNKTGTLALLSDIGFTSLSNIGKGGFGILKISGINIQGKNITCGVGLSCSTNSTDIRINSTAGSSITSINSQAGPAISIVRENTNTTITNSTNQVKVGIGTNVVTINQPQTIVANKTLQATPTLSADLKLNTTNRNFRIIPSNNGTILIVPPTSIGTSLVQLTHTSGDTQVHPVPNVGAFNLIENYQPTNVTTHTNIGYRGFHSTVTYGTSSLNATGSTINFVAEQSIKGVKGIDNEHAAYYGALVYDNGTIGNAWMTDFTVRGPINKTMGILGGINMFINNYCNCQPSERPSTGIGIVSHPNLGGSQDAEHTGKTTYPIDIGLFIGGRSGNTGSTINTNAFTTAIQIGGSGSNWNVAQSWIGTGISIKDTQIAGIEFKNPKITKTPAIYFNNTATNFSYGIDFSNGLFNNATINFGSKKVDGNPEFTGSPVFDNPLTFASLLVNGTTSPTINAIRQTTGNGSAIDVLNLRAMKTNAGSLADGFGGQIRFLARNSTNAYTQTGGIQVVRDGGDNKGRFQWANGIGQLNMALDNSGNLNIRNESKLCLGGLVSGVILSCDSTNYLQFHRTQGLKLFSGGVEMVIFNGTNSTINTHSNSITNIKLGNNENANSFKITNLNNATLKNDAVNARQLGLLGNMTYGNKCATGQYLSYQSSNQTWICTTLSSTGITSLNGDGSATQTIAVESGNLTMTNAGSTHTIGLGVNVLNTGGKNQTISKAINFTAGNKVYFAGDVKFSPMNLGTLSADPSTLVAGDVWYNNAAGFLKYRNGGSNTRTIPALEAVQSWSGTNTWTGNTIFLGGEDFGNSLYDRFGSNTIMIRNPAASFGASLANSAIYKNNTWTLPLVLGTADTFVGLNTTGTFSANHQFCNTCLLIENSGKTFAGTISIAGIYKNATITIPNPLGTADSFILQNTTAVVSANHEFQSSKLLVENPAKTFASAIANSAIYKNNTLTIPNILGTADTFDLMNTTGTFTVNHQFQSGTLLIENPAKTFASNIANSAIYKNNTLTIPNIIGTADTFAMLNTTETFLQKQTFTGSATSAPISLGTLAGAPSTRVEGDLWSSAGSLFYANNIGTTRTVVMAETGGTVSGAKTYSGNNIFTGANNFFGNQNFQSGKLLVENPAKTFDSAIANSAIYKNNTLTLPNILGTADTFGMLNTTQSWLLNNEYQSGKLLLDNPAKTFDYAFTASAIYKNSTVTIPLILGTADTFLLQNTTTTITANHQFCNTCLLVENSGKTFADTISSGAQYRNATINIPKILGTSDTFGLLNTTGTWVANQNYKSGTLLIENPAKTFDYALTASAITANRTFTLPLTTQTETIAVQPQKNFTASSNKTGTSSLTSVMLGDGITLTPTVTGNVEVSVSGYTTQSGAADGCTVQVRQGTGGPPANAAALTGTAFGSNIKSTHSATTTKVPFGITVQITGLTVGTKIWVELSERAETAGTCTVNNVNWAIKEL